MATSITDVIEKLREPFKADQLKTRKQSFTDRKTGEIRTIDLTYVEVPAIIDRLNMVTGGDWSYKIKEHFSANDQVIVLGEMTVLGVTKEAFGGDAIGHGDENVVNAYKGACGDSMRLCAKAFGVGLDLWVKDRGSATAAESGGSGGRKNKFAGKCDRCDGDVAAEAGFTQKAGDKWIIFHSECPISETPATADMVERLIKVSEHIGLPASIVDKAIAALDEPTNDLPEPITVRGVKLVKVPSAELAMSIIEEARKHVKK